MGYELVLEQQQKLIMTPELRLALKILQLPTIELEEMVELELESNPVLEVIENNQEEKTDMTETKAGDKDDRFDEIDWKEYLQYQGKSYYMSGGESEDSTEFSYENFFTYGDTLKDHLLFQFNSLKMDKKQKKIGLFIIESIDDNGYLSITTDEIAEILKVAKEEVEEILNIIQSFEPAGVGATSLSECLLIQIKHKGIQDKALETIIMDYLDDIACNRILHISKKLSISVSEAQNYSDMIKSLEPKPGRSFFCGTECKYVVPDVFIEKIDDEYTIIVNDSYGPRLMINQYYKKIINKGDASSDAEKFVKEKLSSALWLIKSIEQRKNTLYRVMEAILEHQKEFFEKGDKFLKTMTLKNIADMIDVHESTVSRAISGKYAETPKGIFEIKYFFKSGVGNHKGDEISSESIKKMIETIINEEDSKKPVSDKSIAEQLKNKGFVISRRTVAKYRDDIGIPSSSKRRRY